jgi:hypothetical protein
MKPVIFFFLLALVTASADLYSQKPVLVFEDITSFGTATYPGIAVTIPEVVFEQTRNNWIKEIEKGTRSTAVTTSDEISIFGARKKGISPVSMNVYSKMLNQDSMVRLTVAFELKKDYYISKVNNESEFNAAKEFLFQFAKNQYLGFLKERLKVESKSLKALNKELNSLKKDKSQMQKSTLENRSSIVTEKDNIFLGNNELTRLSTEILEQTNQLAVMEEGPAKEEKASYIKELEKQKKRLEKDIKLSDKRIRKANTSISQTDRDIPKTESEQETVRAKIANQEAIVREITNKLSTVKAY